MKCYLCGADVTAGLLLVKAAVIDCPKCGAVTVTGRLTVNLEVGGTAADPDLYPSRARYCEQRIGSRAWERA